MQNIEKMTNFRCFFGHLKVFDDCKINITKKVFKVIACENCVRQVRLLRFPLMQKFQKISKKSIFTALEAPADFEIFDQFLYHFKSIAAEQLFITVLLCSKRRTKKFFTPP